MKIFDTVEYIFKRTVDAQGHTGRRRRKSSGKGREHWNQEKIVRPAEVDQIREQIDLPEEIRPERVLKLGEQIEDPQEIQLEIEVELRKHVPRRENLAMKLDVINLSFTLNILNV